jgi:hypothetical protein
MVDGNLELPPWLAGYRDLGGADFKAASEAVLAHLWTREQMDEIIQVLREQIRRHDERIAQRACDRANPEIQQALDALAEAPGGDADAQRTLADARWDAAEAQSALAEAQRGLTETHRLLSEENRLLAQENRALSADIKALIARLDAIIRDQNNDA